MSKNDGQKASADHAGGRDRAIDSGGTDSKKGDKSFVVLFDDESDVKDTAKEEDNSSGTFVVLLDEPDENLEPGEENREPELCRITRKDTKAGIELPVDMTVRYALDIKTQLVETLDASEVEFDASKVRKLDTASVQLLAAYILDLDQHNVHVKWKDASTEFIDTSRLLGVDFQGSWLDQAKHG
jgi:ABC-type transporter Mla MlaB component